LKIGVIGGGAAGFFAAIHAKENHPQAEVLILEKSQETLSKVKISGGGRCNVTNACPSISQLVKSYPRGSKLLKKAFQEFNNQHTLSWFADRGVAIVAEPDGRMFPKSNSSQSIIDVFLTETKRLQIPVILGAGVKQIIPLEEGFKLKFQRGREDEHFDKLIIASGGSARKKGLEWMEDLGHKIVEPVPSLFTFNMPKNPIQKLMGLVAKEVQVSIQGTKLQSEGPLLITHWGMSGPAILKLSAFGARDFAKMNYEFKVQVNWAKEANQQKMLDKLEALQEEHPKKQLGKLKAIDVPERLWHFLLAKAELSADKKMEDLGKKAFNKLTSVLCHDVYEVKGKTTFKEEFVTAGGVSLESIHPKSMESKVCPGMYFAGEVLDIDGITGGFNFQAAWTTGYLAGRLGISA